jgi:putative FmdB family regulatory protein
MPTYEYECKSCGHNFDVFQSILDEPLRTCPECGKELRRLINGGTGVIFKGSGFCVNDKSGKSGQSSISVGDKASAAGNAEGSSSGAKTTETKTTGTDPSPPGAKPEVPASKTPSN